MKVSSLTARRGGPALSIQNQSGEGSCLSLGTLVLSAKGDLGGS